jgi:hypothetical protein
MADTLKAGQLFDVDMDHVDGPLPQAGEEQMLNLKRRAVAAAGRRHLHDPAGADPGRGDVWLCLIS